MSKRVRWSFLFLLALIAAGVAFCQIRSATITGTVTDPSGAVITGAQVTVTEQLTSVSNTAKTTEAGIFTIPYLPAGTYTVAVTAPGFADYRLTGLALGAGQTIRSDAELKLASVGTAVEVAAQAAAIQTDSSTVQTAIDARAIDILPNPTSNPLYYAALQPGVVSRLTSTDTTTMDSFGIGVHGRKAWNAIGINGGRAWTNDVQLDGLPVMGGGYNELSVLPNTEGLSEVKVISNQFSAQYGRGQGIIQMNTKSGTNQFHGDLSYQVRNDLLMANSRANKASSSAEYPKGIPRPQFKTNEIGGSVGGPIIKDKLFFFASYHYLRFNRGLNNLRTILTPREAVGDFSQTLIRNEAGIGVPVQIYDPYNVTQISADLYRRALIPNANLTNYPGSQYAKTWFSNSVSGYPTPNRTPDDELNTNNFFVRTVQTLRRNNSNNRLDYRRGKHSVYGSGGIQKSDNNTPRIYGKEPVNSVPAVVSDDNPYAQLGDTIVVNPSLIVDLRYGISRINAMVYQGNTKGWTPELYDKFGMPRNLYPYFSIMGSAPVLPITDPGNAKNRSRQLSHSFTTSATKLQGRWSFKFGGEARNLLSNYIDPVEISASYPSGSGGNYNFEYVTRDGSSSTLNTLNVQRGITNARYFLGVPGWSISPGRNVAMALSQKYMAVYTQNDWRATNKLTLNLGFRWDLQPGPTDRFDRISGIDLNATNPFGYKGAIAFVGTQGYSRNLWDTQYTNIGPRLGFAYQAMNDLVVRGGFGVSYLPSNSGYFESPLDYGTRTFSSGTQDQPYGPNPNGVPAFRMADDAPLAIAVNADPGAPVVYGASNTYFDRNFKNGRAMQYNFFIEKRFLSTWFASVGFSGSKTDHLYYRAFPIQNNQLLPSDLRASWAAQFIASNLTLNPATELIPNPFQPKDGPLYKFGGALGAATIARQSTYYPYPLLIGNSISMSRGFANWNSLQVRLSHSFSRGIFMDANYTFAKGLDLTNTMEDAMISNPGGGLSAAMMDIKNLRNNKRLGGSDLKHRANGVLLVDLPFGDGKLVDIDNKVFRAALSGWQTGVTLILQGGFPIVVSGATDGALLARPDRVAGVPLEVPKELQHWYDGNTTVTLPNGRKIKPTRNTFLKYYTGAWQGRVVQLPNGRWGADQNWVGHTAITSDDFRGPGRFNMDMTLRRSIQVRENLSLELSAEASNVLNSSQMRGTYSGALGSTVVTPNASLGLVPGMGSSDTFGTISAATYPAREVVLNLRLRF